MSRVRTQFPSPFAGYFGILSGEEKGVAHDRVGSEVQAMTNDKAHPLPNSDLYMRTIAMPKDTNPEGDIFGGWLMSQMDMAGASCARLVAGGRVVTIAVDGFTFHKPMMVGDELNCYCREQKRGRTSVSINVEAWVRRRYTGEEEKVTAGVFTFVALGDDRKPRQISS